MSTISHQQQEAINLAVSCIIEAAEVAGPLGAPSGVVYAVLHQNGMKLATYQSLLDAMQRMGRITVEGHLIKLAKKEA